MHLALEELQAHDGVNSDQKKDQQGDVQQGQHGFEDGVHHHLQAWIREELKLIFRKQDRTVIIKDKSLTRDSRD